MTGSSPLASPEIQAELISEALGSASVGFLVWDEDRRYIAANRAACEILGTTLDELLGASVGGHTVGGLDAIDEAMSKDFSTGRAVIERSGDAERLEVVYMTFPTRTAGMPFMATVIAPVAA